jgi:hypothetical protein
MLAAGCGSVLEPDSRSIILPITRINVPSTVTSGTSFSATFIIESGGCKRFERLETTKTERALTVLARGTEPTSKNIACTDDIRYVTVMEVVTPPMTDPFSVVAKQPDGTEATVQVRVQ